MLQSVGATGAGIFGATFGLPLLITGLVIGAGVGAYIYFSWDCLIWITSIWFYLIKELFVNCIKQNSFDKMVYYIKFSL